MSINNQQEDYFSDLVFNFDNRRVVVVGGSKGIGLQLVNRFLSSGAEVISVSRTQSSEPTSAEFMPLDIRKEQDIIHAFKDIESRGKVDFLINMAAINYFRKYNEIVMSEWDDVFNVNLRAMFIICREVSRSMKKINYGRIINVSSIAGRHRSISSGIHYVSSKAGVIGLTRQLSFELGPYGINVNAVCPSQTYTKMLSDTMTSQQQEKLASLIPLRRIAGVDEQVGPIMFLCSSAASYINGAVIDVNGGQI